MSFPETDVTSSRIDQDTTSIQEAARLIEELKSATFPLAAALRKQANGHEVDLVSARQQAIERINNVYEQIAPASGPRGPQSFTPGDLIASYWDRVSERREYAPTGIGGLNRALSGGLDHDRLYVLLGAPGSGKTTLANQMATHVADAGRPVLYVTSEDTPHTLLSKTIARLGGLDYSIVLKGYADYRERITIALQEFQVTTSARFIRYVDATQGISLDEIYDQALKHFKALEGEATGAPLLVVDYLQRLSRFENLGADARQSATVYTERLRAMACDLHASVLVLSAMNRASGYHAGNSTIAAAKESGDIDYTADTIMAIGAQEDAPEPAPGLRRWMLRLDKNRQGATTYDQNHIYLDWWPARQQFTEASQETVSYGSSSAGSNGRSRRGR